MKKNKLINLIIILVFVICLVSICFSLKKLFSKSDKNDEHNNNTNGEINDYIKKNDIKNINDFIDYVKTYENNNRSDYNNQYNLYYIDNGILNGHNFNTTKNRFINNLNYEFGVDKNIYNGKIYIRNDGAIYFSVSSDKKCYVKSLDSEEIEFYDISEKDKCHMLYFINDDETASLLVYNSVNGNLYNQGQISDSSLRISVITNLLDEDAATYRWYRNNTLVENNSSSTILIESDEDAEYYAQVIFSNNEFIQTDPVTIKIKK